MIDKQARVNILKSAGWVQGAISGGKRLLKKKIGVSPRTAKALKKDYFPTVTKAVNKLKSKPKPQAKPRAKPRAKPKPKAEPQAASTTTPTKKKVHPFAYKAMTAGLVGTTPLAIYGGVQAKKNISKSRQQRAALKQYTEQFKAQQGWG